jgi:hypothetical protein
MEFILLPCFTCEAIMLALPHPGHKFDTILMAIAKCFLQGLKFS